MILSATGIVLDHYGDVLLIQRDDTRTLAPPGGAADIGELPSETVAREVREETGLIVMPVRLVGIYYLPTKPNDYLALCFRCIIRGGEISTSTESPQAGFFKTNPLPKPMLDLHREQIQRSLKHQGGPPYWGSHKLSTRLQLGNMLMNRIIYPWLHLRRRRAGLPQYVPPPAWQAHSVVIIRDQKGRVLWTKEKEGRTWMLPGAISPAKVTPWETAEHAVKSTTGLKANLNGLSGVYPSPNKPDIVFSFTTEMPGTPGTSPAGDSAYFALGHEPENALPQHLSFVLDAAESAVSPVFRLLDLKQSETTPASESRDFSVRQNGKLS